MINKKILSHLCVITAFTLGIGVITVNIHDNDSSSDDVITVTSEQPVAGVTSEFNSSLIYNHEVTAGVTSELLNQTFVTESDTNIVTAAQDAGLQIKRLEQMEEKRLSIRKRKKQFEMFIRKNKYV